MELFEIYNGVKIWRKPNNEYYTDICIDNEDLEFEDLEDAKNHINEVLVKHYRDGIEYILKTLEIDTRKTTNDYIGISDDIVREIELMKEVLT